MATNTHNFTDLYNFVMSGLEPELTTDVMPYLDEMYEDETPAEQAERLERYQSAINECQDIMETYQVEHEHLVEVYEQALYNQELLDETSGRVLASTHST